MGQKRNLVGLSQISKATGFTRMTVSNALRFSPKVKKETGVLIREAAARLGYVPDPRMAALMSGVRATKTRELLPIAWINTAEEQYWWHNYKWLSPYLEGAEKRAAGLGYKLDELWLGEPGMTTRRLSRIMLSRGIRGAIITPATAGMGIAHLNFDWRHFCWVSFENALLAPRVHKVVQAYYYNLLLALKILRRGGYRRIGLFVQTLEERRSHHMYLSALHYFQKGILAGEHVKPLIYRSVWEDKDPGLPVSEWVARERNKPGHGRLFDKPKALLSEWIARERPDVVVGQHSDLVDWLGAVGLRVPEDIGVAHLALDDDCADWAGIWQNKRHIGAQAVQQLVSMIQSNQPGIPEIAHETLIRGTWRHGKTLRPPRGAVR